MEQKKDTPSSKQFRAFAGDLYEYIWTKHTFCSSYLEKKFAEQLSLKLSQTEDTENSPFNEDIGKAVICSQYLLRELCFKFFKRMEKYMNLSKKSFIYCVYLTQYVCREFRYDDVFLTFIDACAIIAEAFLFCDKVKFSRDICEAPEMLIALFKLQISKKFFEKGGWPQLQEQVLDQYSSVYSFLSIYITKLDDPYATLPHDCKLTQFLRDSPVTFPVHFSQLCANCIMDTDEDDCFYLHTKYSVEEFIKQYSLELPSLDQEKLEDILSQTESCTDSEPSLANSNSYIFLGSKKENVESLDVDKMKTIRKKRKRKQTLLA